MAGKRFQFQLETVLDFKQQELDALMVEHGVLQEQVSRQTALRDQAARRLREYDEEYAQKRARGMTVLKALECQACLQKLEQDLKAAEGELAALEQMAEAKRLQVVEARKGTFSLEKLRELRQAEFSAAAQKAEESMIDELTAARWTVSNA